MSRSHQRYVLATLLLSISCSNGFVVQPSIRSVNLRSIENTPQSTIQPSRSPSSALYGKLWNRLEIEEDPEPMWYLLNCIAGLELDLLRLCRAKCGDHEDVVKFVVPIEKSTRSHGPNRIVTDVKVKYQGYVFGKLRLCEDIYEDVQELDLCRSWMGTVNKKGYKKLPPAPVALNELEIEKFGLEDLQEGMEDDRDPTEELLNEEGVILDTAENEAKINAKLKKKGPKIDEEQLKAYLDLRVDDMIKVTASNKFKGEDGVVKRLKGGQILIRFFTYGSTYDEWLAPEEVRKMSNEEVLRGLQGPDGPVTQQDLEGGNGQSDDRRSDRSGSGGGLRGALMNNVSGNRGPRNTRFERTDRGDAFKRDMFGRTDNERKSEEENWSWYQDQQRSGGRPAGGRNNAGGRGNDRDAAMGDVDSQWGRFSQRQERRERGPRDNARVDKRAPPRNSRDTQRVESALDGGDDWSAFVTPATSPSKKSSSGNDDEFFSSLMSELNGDQDSQSAPSPSKKEASNDDDFFSSLMSELNDGEGDSNKQTQDRRPVKKEPPVKSDDNDFFAALEAELGSAEPVAAVESGSGTDDFFAKLEAEMKDSGPKKAESKPVASPADDGNDDFFANLEKEMTDPGFDGATNNGATTEVSSTPVADDKNADFFADLEAELASPINDSSEEDQKKAVVAMRSKPAEIQATPQSSADGGSLGKKTVPALKDMLRERGLKVSGKKAELIERLLQ